MTTKNINLIMLLLLPIVSAPAAVAESLNGLQLKSIESYRTGYQPSELYTKQAETYDEFYRQPTDSSSSDGSIGSTATGGTRSYTTDLTRRGAYANRSVHDYIGDTTKNKPRVRSRSIPMVADQIEDIMRDRYQTPPWSGERGDAPPQKLTDDFNENIDRQTDPPLSTKPYQDFGPARQPVDLYEGAKPLPGKPIGFLGPPIRQMSSPDLQNSGF